MGKQLLKIGYTVFNEEEKPISINGKNPGFHSITRKKETFGYPPLYFLDMNNGKIEVILTRLFPRYIILKKEYGLDKTLLSRWWCEIIPLEFHIPIMHQAIEVLAKNWISSPDFTNKTSSVDKKDYEFFFQEIEQLLTKKFGTHENFR